MNTEEMLDILDNDEFDIDWNCNEGRFFRSEVSKSIKERELLNSITENNQYIRRQDAIDVVNYYSKSDCIAILQKLPIYAPVQFEHRYSPSTLKNMSKAELINQIHCLVNNNDALQERVQNQADYPQKIIELIEPAHDEKPTKYFYFSFGSNDKFPYKNGYVVVKAKNELEATKEFKQHCPNRPETDYINCAFIYPQQEWNEIPPNFKGKCHAVFQNGIITGANPDLSYLEEKEYSERE